MVFSNTVLLFIYFSPGPGNGQETGYPVWDGMRGSGIFFGTIVAARTGRRVGPGIGKTSGVAPIVIIPVI